MTTELTEREFTNDLLHQELRAQELIRLDEYHPESVRNAASARITKIIRELAREGRFTETEDADVEPTSRGKKRPEAGA